MPEVVHLMTVGDALAKPPQPSHHAATTVSLIMPALTDTRTVSPDQGDWTLIIQPQGRLFDLKLQELWHYRDLITLFVRRDFVAQYKQTILGPAWHFIVSALTTRNRDLTVVVDFGVQLLMYATPVIYPLSILPEPYRTWMLLNPMAPIMEIFRYAYLGAGQVSLGLLLYATALIGLILFVGVLLFNRVERTFMDTV